MARVLLALLRLLGPLGLPCGCERGVSSEQCLSCVLVCSMLLFGSSRRLVVFCAGLVFQVLPLLVRASAYVDHCSGLCSSLAVGPL